MRAFGFGARGVRHRRRLGLGGVPAAAPVILAVIAGQSNAEGRTSRDPAIDGDVPGAWQFIGHPGDPAYRTITPDVTPLRHHDGGDQLGPGEYVARRLLADNPDARILLVPTARGSTRLVAEPAEWASAAAPGAGGFLFENMVEQANRAHAAAEASWPGSPIRVRLFWVQGEFDATGGVTRAAYLAALTDLIARFRSRVKGAAAAPVVIGSMVPDLWRPDSATRIAGYVEINAAHVAASLLIPGVFYAKGPDDPGNLNDNLHYQPAAAVREQGGRLAAALTATPGPSIAGAEAFGSAEGSRLALVLTGSGDHQTFHLDPGLDSDLFEISDPYLAPTLRWVDDGPGSGVGSYAVRVRARSGAGIYGPARTLTVAVAAAGHVSPAGFFTAGERGMVWDLTDQTTLFQDVAGAIPVSAPGQPVGRVLDKSPNANHWTAAANDASRPTYRLDGDGKPFLDFDGADDILFAATPFVQVAGNGRFSATIGMTPGVLSGERDALGCYSVVDDTPFVEPFSQYAGEIGINLRNDDSGGFGPGRPTLPGLLDGMTRRVMTSQYGGQYAIARIRDAAGRASGFAAPLGVSVTQGAHDNVYAVTRAALGGRGFGRPAGFFAGRIYSGYVINRLVTDAEVRNAEDWAAARCGVMSPEAE